MTGRVAGEVEVLRFVPSSGVAISEPQEHQDLLAIRDGRAPNADIAGGGVEERLDGRLPTDGFVEGHSGEAGLCAEALPLLRFVANAYSTAGIPWAVVSTPAESMDRDQQRGLFGGDVTVIVRVPDLGTEAITGEYVARALRVHPSGELRHPGVALRDELVRRPEPATRSWTTLRPCKGRRRFVARGDRRSDHRDRRGGTTLRGRAVVRLPVIAPSSDPPVSQDAGGGPSTTPQNVIAQRV